MIAGWELSLPVCHLPFPSLFFFFYRAAHYVLLSVQKWGWLAITSVWSLAKTRHNSPSIFLARETGEMHLISSFPLSESISVVRLLSCMTSKLQVQIARVTPVRLTSNLQFLIIIFFSEWPVYGWLRVCYHNSCIARRCANVVVRCAVCISRTENGALCVCVSSCSRVCVCECVAVYMWLIFSLTPSPHFQLGFVFVHVNDDKMEVCCTSLPLETLLQSHITAFCTCGEGRETETRWSSYLSFCILLSTKQKGLASETRSEDNRQFNNT